MSRCKSWNPRDNFNAAEISAIILSDQAKFDYGTNLPCTAAWSSQRCYLCRFIKIWKLTPALKHRLEMAA